MTDGSSNFNSRTRGSFISTFIDPDMILSFSLKNCWKCQKEFGEKRGVYFLCIEKVLYVALVAKINMAKIRTFLPDMFRKNDMLTNAFDSFYTIWAMNNPLSFCTEVKHV